MSDLAIDIRRRKGIFWDAINIIGGGADDDDEMYISVPSRVFLICDDDAVRCLCEQRGRGGESKRWSRLAAGYKWGSVCVDQIGQILVFLYIVNLIFI